MRWSSRSGRLAAMLVAGFMVMSACGSDKDESDAGSDDGGGSAAKTVKIGVIAPLSGDLSALGAGIKNGADLAVKQANEEEKIEGWKFVLDAQDDTANPQTAGTVASKLASDSKVIGVVGTLNSSTAEQVQPILDQAGIVMVSPANTNPTLSQGADPAGKKRPYPTYFRVSTTDAVQGPFAADYALEGAGFKKAIIIHDKKTYGQGLANAFKTRFEEKGGKVLTVETVDPEEKKFDAVLSKVKPLGGDFIYYGGEYPAASLISSQANGIGLTIPLMGGDGIYSGTFIEVAQAGGEGDLATSVGGPTDQLASAKSFVDAYEAAGYADPYEAYGAYSYDATNVIIDAAAKVLPDVDAIDDEVLADIVAAVGETDLEGATGPVSFDEFGDTNTKVLTVYKVEAGPDGLAWKPQKTDEFK